MQLTRDNYYTPEADLEFMSCSQYQSWLSCEAATWAMIQGRYKGKEDSEAFLVGNYVHSALESEKAHNQFLNEHFDDIFKMAIDKKTEETVIKGKYAAYEKADEMLKAFYSDDTIRGFIELPGENEKIMHGELFGVPWRIRIDKYIADRQLIIDYKTCADFYKTEYNPVTKAKESFVETYGYVMRAAVYSEIEKQFMQKDIASRFMLICVSKQEPPDKDLFLLNSDARFTFELEEIKKHLPRIQLIKQGARKPLRCGKCEYCRATKKITHIKNYYELTPGFENPLEEDEY